MAETSIVPYILVGITLSVLGILLVFLRKQRYVIPMTRKKTISPVGPIMGTIIAGQALIAAFMFFGLAEKNIDFIKVDDAGIIDISNWAASIISIIAGGVVAISILIYTILSQRRFNNFLSFLEDRENARINHQQRELVNSLVYTRRLLHVINNTINELDHEMIFDFETIRVNWNSLTTHYDAIYDVLISSSDVLNQDLVTNLRIVKGELKTDFSRTQDVLSVSIRLTQLENRVRGILTNELNAIRLLIINEMTNEMNRLIELARTEENHEEKVESIRLWHTAEISKFSLNN